MIISDNQIAFIPGLLITDNITVAYEVMHYMKRKSKSKDGWMAIKLDISKAYDRVKWGFLIVLLKKMGFDNKVVKLFMTCMSSVWYQLSYAGRIFIQLLLPEA